jgi:predicted AAA+ superfamily ATPase
LIGDLLRELPALLLVGPRATGKTTTAARHARSVARLDRPTEAAAFAADPDAALRGMQEPVLLDEWQAVPDVLGAVKRAVDSDPRPGRFLVTGSVRADLQQQVWPGTGRLVRVGMTGLTVRELLGRVSAAPFVDRLAEHGLDGLPLPPEPPDLRGYLDLAVRGGFPEAALHLSAATRERWLGGYVEQLLTRDAEALGATRDPDRLRRYFEAYALSTAGLVEDKTLYEAAGVNRKTGDAYEQLLRNLLVADTVPAWTSSRLKRLVRSPKRYVVDTGLVAASLRLTVDTIIRDGDLLGRLLDTFVTAQLRAELPLNAAGPRLYHLRQEQGRHEIDLIAELGAYRVVGIEVKAAAAPTADAARHLRWLREELGDRFVRGVVLHTGPRAYEIDDRIVAAPICALWG